MHFTRSPRLLVAAALLLAPFASSALALGPYLKHFDAIVLLPPPPAVGSDEDRADRDSAFQIYSQRTPAELALGKAEHDFDAFAFAPAIGPFFRPGKLPKVEALLREVIAEVRPPTTAAKEKWNRGRPYLFDPARFSHPGDHEASASYPSGHSTRGTLYALILAEIFPSHRAAILEKGRLIGWTRVEIGVHTPLDIYAGRVVGKALAEALMRNPAFLRDLAEAKAEAAGMAGK